MGSYEAQQSSINTPTMHPMGFGNGKASQGLAINIHNQPHQ